MASTLCAYRYLNVLDVSSLTCVQCVVEYVARESHHMVFKHGPVLLLFIPLNDTAKRETYLKLVRPSNGDLSSTGTAVAFLC